MDFLTLTLQVTVAGELSNQQIQQKKDQRDIFFTLTLALETLVDQPVEKRATVVAEGGRGVGVKSKPMLSPHRLTISSLRLKSYFLKTFFSRWRWIFSSGFRFEGLVTPS